MVLPLILAVGGLGLGLAGMGMAAAPSFGGSVDNVLCGYYTKAQRRKFKQLPSRQLDPPVLASSYWRGLLTSSQYYEMMAENGYNKDRAKAFLESSKLLLTLDQLADAWYKGIIMSVDYYNLTKRLGISKEEAEIYIHTRKSPLNPLDTLNAYWRGAITWDEYIRKMKENGYTPEDAKIFQQANFFFPPQTDLIRFQVREVFRPEIVEKYGYDKEFPTEIVKQGKKLGISEEIMKWYWRAHWALPSPTQMYEMLHRLHPDVLAVTKGTYDYPATFMEECETTPETVEEFLKVADYPDYWRKRLMAISYHALTRVDLRRLYMLGIIEDDYVIATLRESGYSQYDAVKLLEFYKAIKMPKEKRLSMAQIKTLYGYGVLSEEEFEDELKELGYKGDDIKLIKSIIIRGIQEKSIKERIKTYQVEYIEGQITLQDVRTRLGQLGMLSEKIDEIITKFRRAKRKQVKHAPIGDVKRWFGTGLITEEQFRFFLEIQGYAAEYIDVYVKEVRTPKKFT